MGTSVGFCGGFTPNPTYEEGCSGQTGHTEAVLVVYDPSKVAFEALLKVFWEMHDPCQGMGQGNDRGSQYRSGVFPTTADQKKLALRSKAAYEAVLTDKKHDSNGGKITTDIEDPGVPFFYAPDYHQQYLAKPGSRNYCSMAPTGWDLPDPST